MRADRLLSILMLLQARGRMTARALADELEVSVRTIYRDLDALSAAGVPVYAERGPGGGCALLDSYRTTLTGLTQDEVRALFTLGLPAPLSDLGLGGEFKAALHKLAASLPDTHRADELQAQQRIHLDPVGWFETRQPVPHLRTLHQALWQERLVEIVYELPFEAKAAWQIAPYGLVAKASTWHLVCSRGGHLHVYRVARILDARLADEGFAYPRDFDLAVFWGAWCAQAEENRPRYQASVRVAPGLVPYLPRLLGESLDLSGAPDEEGWQPIELVFESLEEARQQILGLGGAVEVLAPRPLRESVCDFAQQAAALYAP
jgi:predicted DNA-binding transcriptional regulator YafY